MGFDLFPEVPYTDREVHWYLTFVLFYEVERHRNDCFRVNSALKMFVDHVPTDHLGEFSENLPPVLLTC